MSHVIVAEMSNAEFTYEPHQEDRRGYAYGISVLNLVESLTMDDDPGDDRPDLWRMSWDELQEPTGGHLDGSEMSQRNTAAGQIRDLYLETLGTLYPQLADVETLDEYIMSMAEIPDLPPCNGVFSSSYYQAQNGNSRMLTYVEASAGNHTSLGIYISDTEQDVVKSYSLYVTPDMTMSGSTGMTLHSDTQAEMETLRCIEPSQRNNLLRIMYGRVAAYELDMKLNEVRDGSKEFTPEDVLDQMLEDARLKYHSTIERNTEEILMGTAALTYDDFKEMSKIVAERVEQLIQ